MLQQISWPTLIAFFLVCQAAGISGSVFTARAVRTWYKDYKKPSFNPPNWVFGPVWTILYTLMGVSGYLLWQHARSSAALILFFIQLFLNAIWTPLFFGAKQLGWAFVDIILMAVAILTTIIISWQVSHLAAYLLLPYLAWVSFASVLNFYLWKLNK